MNIDLFARQENEALKKEKHELQHKIIDLRQSKEELQDKIDKAIEYIKENFDKTGICVSGSDLPYSYIEELLEILGDKENGRND